MNYLVIYNRAGDGYSAHSPDVPGCVAAGESLEETRELMRQALRLHLQAMKEDGQPLPVAQARGEHLDIQVPL